MAPSIGPQGFPFPILLTPLSRLLPGGGESESGSGGSWSSPGPCQACCGPFHGNEEGPGEGSRGAERTLREEGLAGRAVARVEEGQLSRLTLGFSDLTVESRGESPRLEGKRPGV